MKRLILNGLRSGLVCALAFAFVGQAKADIMIDDFTVPNPAITYSLAAPVGSTFVRVDGNRTITVTQTQNDFGVAGFTSGIIGNTALGGRYTQSTGVGTTAFSSIAYTYAVPLNLSAGGTILNFSFTSTDLNVPFSVVVGDGSATSTQVGLVASPTNLAFNLNGFVGVDLTAVTSIQLVLNRNVVTNATTQSADFSIANVTITTPPPTNGVPAPPAAILALVALPIIGLRRKFLKA